MSCYDSFWLCHIKNLYLFRALQDTNEKCQSEKKIKANKRASWIQNICSLEVLNKWNTSERKKRFFIVKTFPLSQCQVMLNDIVWHDKSCLCRFGVKRDKEQSVRGHIRFVLLDKSLPYVYVPVLLSKIHFVVESQIRR